MSELKNSIVKSNESAAGPDGVYYQFLRHLPESCLHTLLKFFNNIWTTWREASVVPIPKPGKDPSDPSNYRPIALTSCLCKTLERMVNDRLVHVLESRNLLSNVQCGFRKDHSTLDHLVGLETAFARKKQVLAVFFDLEKAYHTTWRYGILKDLFDLDFRGRLPIFISNFLKDRHFKVKEAENTFSSSYHQENGVPQGSILSPMLFNLKINNIINSVSKHVNSSLFFDDFAIYAEGKHLQHLERTIQLCINNVQKWVSENGFRLSVSKTTCVHFHRQRIYTEPALHLDGQPIPVKGEAKFLGVIFDQKLSFENHVKYLKNKCLTALNLLRVVGHTGWVADRATLLKLYRTLVRSKLDYGSVIYGSAKKHVLRALDPTHHQGLRIALGAFRTSPIKSLYAEAGEPSLGHRHGQIISNLKDHADHLDETFSNNSSSENYSKNFQQTKQRAEKVHLNFSSENNEPYNNPLLMSELKNYIVKSNESAAGPDGVYYQFLRHLPESCLQTLLKLFNNIWTTGDIPPSWREASVVPIPKPGKDPSDPFNYRPIALTSCLCKTLERMVSDRLVHVLESRNLLSNVQCGFRKDHSTLDHLVRLKTFIKKAFARKKQVLAVFFDLEKAYDTTWRQRIYTEPALHLDGQPIPVKGEAKFLGVIFDQKLSFENHVKYLKNKCLKALNLLHVVGHTDWGADRATLLKLYRTLVRSKLDYGSVIYGSAKKYILRALDPIHHQGLRIALGAFRTLLVMLSFPERESSVLTDTDQKKKKPLQCHSRRRGKEGIPAPVLGLQLKML
ncbi:RNA-directed DNA polymerase from mobile element jockey [Plakobranchus ocellatus]|uniref:RNA-directed DNA polymerase from mobile element jockey n=1 Tax=Plakobranchus ocellatus TaxID=259542 RepID=A0AAV4AX56_9GAST|nr:RNA-directed DNA polymerase from mobile element jockey [Plakobranchus ocellatus]